MTDMTHTCPYGGIIEQHPQWPVSQGLSGPIYGPVSYGNWDCGKAGRLCDRCKQDRADRRTRALVRATLWQLSNTSIRMDAADIESLAISIIGGEGLE